MMEHFKSSVPMATRAKLLEMVTAGGELMADKVSDAYDAPAIEPIYGKAYDGFIPFQDGGYTAKFFAVNGWSSGRFLNATHAEQVRRMESRAYDDLLRDLPDVDTMSDEAGEYLSEYMDDPILVYFEAFIDKSEVTVHCCWNYRDAPYYREKYADDLHSVVYSADEFAALEVADILAEFASCC